MIQTREKAAAKRMAIPQFALEASTGLGARPKNGGIYRIS